MMTLLLGITFLVLATVLGIILTKTNISWWFKTILIIMVLWYSVALAAVPSHLGGWAKHVEMIPENSTIVSYKIIEPKAIYFWIIEDARIETSRANPKEMLKEIRNKEPRAYKIPYDKEIHKQLEETEKQRKKGKKGVLRWQKNKSKEIRGNTKDGPQSPRGKFQIFNFSSLLPSKD
jgi:hypothetical protein